MTSRRSFVAGLLATGLATRASWADVGQPSYLSAARLPNGSYAMVGLSAEGKALFDVPLPSRGHAAAAHPTQPLAVAFARRPGTYALVIDCRTGAAVKKLKSPHTHHFCGHGCFSQDGRFLFTTENDFDQARGMVGVWDVGQDFERIAQFPTSGLGPHDIKLMPDGETLVVANGGIETRPETGRTKLNVPIMRPNLSYISIDGSLVDQIEPPAAWHKNSMRHLSVRADGLVACATQWEGSLQDTPALLATHKLGTGLMFHQAEDQLERRMQGYAGSVAFSADGRQIAVTGPRGALAVVFDNFGQQRRLVNAPDICGVAPMSKDFLFTTGLGCVVTGTDGSAEQTSHTRYQWDNHLIIVGS